MENKHLSGFTTEELQGEIRRRRAGILFGVYRSPCLALADIVRLSDCEASVAIESRWSWTPRCLRDLADHLRKVADFMEATR